MCLCPKLYCHRDTILCFHSPDNLGKGSHRPPLNLAELWLFVPLMIPPDILQDLEGFHKGRETGGLISLRERDFSVIDCTFNN